MAVRFYPSHKNENENRMKVGTLLVGFILGAWAEQNYRIPNIEKMAKQGLRQIQKWDEQSRK